MKRADAIPPMSSSHSDRLRLARARQDGLSVAYGAGVEIRLPGDRQERAGPSLSMALNAQGPALSRRERTGPSLPLSLNTEGNGSMLVGPPSLEALFKAFSLAYNDGFTGAVSHVADVAFEASSSTSEEVYPFLGQFPLFREWVDDRVVTNPVVHGWSIKNVRYEATLKIGRSEIEDDRYGVYGPMFKQMGVNAKTHPDTLIFPLLNAGFTSPCYDGQTFFSAAHPVGTAGGGYNAGVASNMQAGTGPAWFLLCTNQAMRPVIWQKRIPYEFQSLVSPTDANVFFRDEYFYGVRARVNAGYGLWQLAFGSQAPLSADNYAAARTAMMMTRGDRGGILGIIPNLLVVPPSLEENARTLLKATTVAEITGGTVPATGGTAGAGLVVPVTNVWHESADLIVTPFLA